MGSAGVGWALRAKHRAERGSSQQKTRSCPLRVRLGTLLALLKSLGFRGWSEARGIGKLLPDF